MYLFNILNRLSGKRLSVASTLLSLALLPSISYSQQYIKNNLPCIAELCIGDGLEELQKLKWEPARSEMGNTPIASLPAVNPLDPSFKGIFVGKHGKTDNYLNLRKFDNPSLLGFSNVKVACAPNNLTGNFISRSGNPTQVTIALGPMRSESTEQQWVVVEILRKIPKIVTDEQAQEAYKQLDAIYKQFNPMFIYDDKKFYQPGLGMFFATISAQMTYTLSLNYPKSLGDENGYKRHSACGGNNKISLD
jgi:hypothetical protein